MKHLSKILILLICMVQNTQAEDAYLKLDKVYLGYYERLESDPQSVLDEMLAKPEPIDKFDKAQYQYLLSQAYYALVFPDKAISHAKQGLQYVDEKSHPWIFYKLLLSLSSSYDLAGDSAKGIDGVEKALKWANTNKVSDIIQASLTTSGYINISLGHYIEALDQLQQAYLLAKANDDYAHEHIAGAIALVYEYRKEPELSIPFFIEAADYHRKNNNWLELSIALYGLGRAHKGIGEVELGMQELQESADLSIKVGDHQGVGYALKEMAGQILYEGNFEKAEEMLLESLEAFKTANNKMMLFDNYKVLSELKLKTNQIEQSQIYLEKAMTYVDKEKQPIQYITINKLAADILAHKGEFEKAFNDLRKIIAKEKKLITQQSTKQLHQLRSQFELESIDKENKILAQEVELQNTQIFAQNKQNQLLFLLFVFALTVSGLLLFIALRLRKNKKHFEYLANYDGLTGVYTRSKTLELLKKALQNSKDNDDYMCVGMLDLDYFKNINDQFGHATGDLVLKELGVYLKKLVNHEDICGRFGGEEFVIGLIKTNQQKAQEKFELIRTDIEGLHKKLNIKHLKVTLSAGICSNLGHNNIDEMIKCADDALYQAKENGRNQIVYIKD